jgi:hypothetical protein
MPTQPPCPFNETCGGTIQLYPDLHVEQEHEIINGQECVTNITVYCFLIAECSNCSYTELVDQERRYMTFDQFYHFNEPNEPSPDFLAEIEGMNRLVVA